MHVDDYAHVSIINPQNCLPGTHMQAEEARVMAMLVEHHDAQHLTPPPPLTPRAATAAGAGGVMKSPRTAGLTFEDILKKAGRRRQQQQASGQQTFEPAAGSQQKLLVGVQPAPAITGAALPLPGGAGSVVGGAALLLPQLSGGAGSVVGSAALLLPQLSGDGSVVGGAALLLPQLSGWLSSLPCYEEVALAPLPVAEPAPSAAAGSPPLPPPLVAELVPYTAAEIPPPPPALVAEPLTAELAPSAAAAALPPASSSPLVVEPLSTVAAPAEHEPSATPSWACLTAEHSPSSPPESERAPLSPVESEADGAPPSELAAFLSSAPAALLSSGLAAFLSSGPAGASEADTIVTAAADPPTSAVHSVATVDHGTLPDTLPDTVTVDHGTLPGTVSTAAETEGQADTCTTLEPEQVLAGEGTHAVSTVAEQEQDPALLLPGLATNALGPIPSSCCSDTSSSAGWLPGLALDASDTSSVGWLPGLALDASDTSSAGLQALNVARILAGNAALLAVAHPHLLPPSPTNSSQCEMGSPSFASLGAAISPSRGGIPLGPSHPAASSPAASASRGGIPLPGSPLQCVSLAPWAGGGSPGGSPGSSGSGVKSTAAMARGPSRIPRAATCSRSGSGSPASSRLGSPATSRLCISPAAAAAASSRVITAASPASRATSFAFAPHRHLGQRTFGQLGGGGLHHCNAFDPVGASPTPSYSSAGFGDENDENDGDKENGHGPGGGGGGGRNESTSRFVAAVASPASAKKGAAGTGLVGAAGAGRGTWAAGVKGTSPTSSKQQGSLMGGQRGSPAGIMPLLPRTGYVANAINMQCQPDLVAALKSQGQPGLFAAALKCASPPIGSRLAFSLKSTPLLPAAVAMQMKPSVMRFSNDR